MSDVDRELMRDVRSRLLSAVDLHDEMSHDGMPCQLNRIGALAFLAHSLGLKPDEMQLVAIALLEYEASHALHEKSNGSSG